MSEETQALRVAVVAARELYEQVQTDESVGICLSDRVATLRLGDALSRIPGRLGDFCENWVEVSGDRWAGTYCKLLAGHDGPCSALYPDERATA